MDLQIDRLTLRLPGLSETDARRVARLVVDCLASADAPGAARASEHLRVSVTLRPGEALEAVAQRIASEMLFALARSS